MINYKVILSITQLQAIWEKPSDSLEVKGGESGWSAGAPRRHEWEEWGFFSLS